MRVPLVWAGRTVSPENERFFRVRCLIGLATSMRSMRKPARVFGISRPRVKTSENAVAKYEKSPPEASFSLGSYDDEGGVTPRPHTPFDHLFRAFAPFLSTRASAA